jgi:hypothetical protein
MYTRVGRFAILKDDFELQEIPESFHPIKMYAGSSASIQRSVLAHATGLTIRQ